MTLITQAEAARVPEPDRAAVLSITVDEVRRMHEGVLARYGLRPSEFAGVEGAGCGLSYEIDSC